MIRHWFRLLWNRRRSNGAIVTEIAICFVVLCIVSASLLHRFEAAQAPLGYDWRDAHLVNLRLGSYYEMPEEERGAVHAEVGAFLRTVQAHPDVVTAALSTSVPYERSRMRSGVWFERDVVYFEVGDVTLQADEVLDLEIAEGRWFEPSDVGSPDRPVVVSRGLARTFFGDTPAVGQRIPNQDEEGNDLGDDADYPMGRVIGVFDDYRRQGEFGPTHDMMFRLVDLSNASIWIPSRMIVRTTPGAGAAVEESLIGTMRAAAPQWDFRTQRLETLRSDRHREQLFLPLTGLVVAAFLVLMVGLGLVGVLWQSVARRTAEFGLRRALGAASSDIRALVLGELVALATVAALIGAAVFVQAPLLGIVSDLSVRVWIGAIAVSAVVLYSFVLLCGLYPSWLATRIEPARALQYE